jgi:hypothetical protein
MKFASDLQLPFVHMQTHCCQVQHRDHSCCCNPGASAVLSSSVTASAMLASMSAMTAISSSSGHGEEYEYEECV